MQKFNRYQRATARLAAVQSVYAIKVGDQQGETILDNILNFQEENWEKPDIPFLRNLVESCQVNMEEICAHVEKNLTKDWTMSRIDKLILSILICAVNELLFEKEIPAQIILKEYVDLAADFFDAKDVNFINASLNALRTNIRQE